MEAVDVNVNIGAFAIEDRLAARGSPWMVRHDIVSSNIVMLGPRMYKDQRYISIYC
jgi:hypothetical protein